jgi:hypothetical protein
MITLQFVRTWDPNPTIMVRKSFLGEKAHFQKTIEKGGQIQITQPLNSFSVAGNLIQTDFTIWEHPGWADGEFRYPDHHIETHNPG